jgi:hypothetical protein
MTAMGVVAGDPACRLRVTAARGRTVLRGNVAKTDAARGLLAGTFTRSRDTAGGFRQKDGAHV